MLFSNLFMCEVYVPILKLCFLCFSSGIRLMSSKKEETDAEFDARFEAYFNRADIDGWEIRKAMHDLSGIDMVPGLVTNSILIC